MTVSINSQTAGTGAKAPFVVYSSSVPVVAPADTNLNTIATINIPVLGPNDTIRITLLFSFGAGSANNKTINCLFGTLDTLVNFTNATLGTLSHYTVRTISNRNSQSSQVSFGSWANGGSDVSGTQTGNVNTALPSQLLIKATKAVAGDTIQMDQCIVEIIPG